MISNLVNRHDLVRLYNKYNSGQASSVLEKLRGSSKDRVVRQWSDVDREPRQWWSIPAVGRRWNQLITGDESMDFPSWVATAHLRGRSGLRALSLGCGTGDRELRWAELGVFERLDAFDITPEVIAVATAKARSAGLDHLVNFEVRDFTELDAARPYDVIIAEHSLHHLAPMPDVVSQIEQLLAPSGLLIVDEFVGPKRFQWSDVQVAEANSLLRTIPERYRRLPSGEFKTSVVRPSILWMLLTDPSEAIDSERILPSLHSHFDVLDERPYGGALLHIALSDISQNFADDPDSVAVLQEAFEIEDALMEQGRVDSDFVALVCRKRTAPGPLVDDDFPDPLPPGQVVGSRSRDGARRGGTDRFATMSVDNDQLRIGWMEHPSRGSSVLSYGPFAGDRPMTLAVRFLNGLTTSQSDWRVEGRRAMLRRWSATLPRGPLRRPELRDNLVIGWYARENPAPEEHPVAAVIHRAGDHQAGELWFQAGASRVRLCDNLQNIPSTCAVTVREGLAELHGWSYPGAACYRSPGDTEALASISIGPAPETLHAVIHQPVLGEVFYRVDTRVDRVQVIPAEDQLPATLSQVFDQRWWNPEPDDVLLRDDFEGSEGDLAQLSDAHGLPWERLMVAGVIERSGAGSARVRGSIESPNPGRTIYGVPLGDPGGAALSVVVTPPGTEVGQGHRGRGGVAFWQDEDNHFIVNTWIDDAMVGVSLSAFLRVGGREDMFEWDAVWTNVGPRIKHGTPFELIVACDGERFLCRLDGEPVLYRAFTDYRSDSTPLRIGHVGLVANWEWGDDTGTFFDHFAARRIKS